MSVLVCQYTIIDLDSAVGAGSRHTGVTSTQAHDDLANVDTGNSSVGLAPSTTHTSLQSIGTGTRQHLVDTDDVEGVGANAQVERVLSAGLDHVLVGANTSGLEGLRAQLLVLVGDHVDAEREVIDGSLLATKIEDANLGVGDTTVEPGLGVGLVKSVILAMDSVMYMLETLRVSQALKVVLRSLKIMGLLESANACDSIMSKFQSARRRLEVFRFVE